MWEKKAETRRDPRLPDVIRKEIGTEANRRHLARMPAFRPEREIPEKLLTLLGEIDRAEAGR